MADVKARRETESEPTRTREEAEALIRRLDATREAIMHGRTFKTDITAALRQLHEERSTITASMSLVVIDAGIALRRFVGGSNADEVIALVDYHLRHGDTFIAPQLIAYEVASVLHEDTSVSGS